MKLLFACGVLLAAACGFGDNSLNGAGGGGVTHHRCGDGVIDVGEGCDDGNTTSGDGCSSTCAVETPSPVCGNGTLETGEGCDDGNTTSGDGCSSTCMPEAVCGNGAVEPGEQCDDGNTASGDGCSPTCQAETVAACGLFPQSGCGGTTPACDLDPNTGTSCRMVSTSGTSNDHCTVDTACKAGFTCVHGDTGQTPWCMPFCLHDGDCIGSGSRCVDHLYDAQGQATNVTVCSNSCNAATQTGCPSGMACYASEDAGGDYTDCLYAGTHAVGTACTSSNDCVRGAACAQFSGDTPKCYATCLVGGTTACAGGLTCAPFNPTLQVGSNQYGVCH